MVDVVISVLSVTTYTVKIVDALQVFHQLIHLVICIEVSGIRLLHLFHMGIQYHIRAVNEAQIHHFLYTECGELLFRHIPELVTFIDEIFQTDPDCILQIFDHVRRPVVVNLETSHFNTSVLHIYPAVRHNVADSFQLCFILQVNLRYQYT